MRRPSLHTPSTIAALCLAPLFALTACESGTVVSTDAGPPDAPSGDASSGDASPDAVTPMGDLESTYCRPLSQSICESASECGCGVVLPGGAVDVPACTTRLTAECMTGWGPFLDMGAVLDPAAASACAAMIEARTLPCDEPSGLVVFATCAPFLVDPAAIGASCRTPYCAGGEGRCVEGTCRAAAGVDAPCGGMFACDAGLVCDDGTCRALLAEGASGCDADLDCAPPLRCIEGSCSPLRARDAACTDSSQCERGLICDAGACAIRESTTCSESENPCGSLERCAAFPVCVAQGGAGASCADNADCAAELYCADETRTCQARPGLDQACGNGVSCAAGLGCDLDGAGLCRALPGMGQPCLFGEFGPFLCAEGLACSDGTCGPLPTEGQPCAGSDTCAPGLGCAFGPDGSTCITPRGVGEPCENRQACRAELHCGDEGTCVADVAIGEPCRPGYDDCATACLPDDAGTFRCRALLADGERCAFDDDCGASLTCLAREADSRCLPLVCGAL